MSMTVGVSSFHYAKIIKDSITGVTYSDPVAIPGLAEVTVTPSSSTDTFFADNGPFEVATTLGEISLSVQLADVDLAMQADILGHSLTAGVMSVAADDTAPMIAVGFKALKANGKYRYVWLLEGQFQEPTESFKTKGDKVDFSAQTIEGKFVIRTFDRLWKKMADEDATGYLPATGLGWFEATTLNAGVPQVG